MARAPRAGRAALLWSTLGPFLRAQGPGTAGRMQQVANGWSPATSMRSTFMAAPPRRYWIDSSPMCLPKRRDLSNTCPSV